MIKSDFLDPIYIEIAKVLQKALEEAGCKLSVPEIGSELVEAPNSQLGHFCYPCFKLAKPLKKKPNEISQSLAETVSSDLISAAKGVGPYLNLFIHPKYLYQTAVQEKSLITDFQTDKMQLQPILIEYSQPNTHKELHVGHMRNLCFGNALVRLLRYSGRPVSANTYPGDVGTHVAKCLWYLSKHAMNQLPTENHGEWLGAIYTKANALLEEEKGTDKEDQNRLELTEILKQLKNHEGDFHDLWLKTREWSIEQMKSIYEWADVQFDHWYFESEVDQPSVEWVKELHANNQLILSEGAIGMDLSDQKLGFCMLLKTDGNGLYATKDLLLARNKIKDSQPSYNLYIVDMRQELHFKQVFATLAKIGFEEEAKICQHIKYNFVELPDGAMSSRKGNIVPLRQLITEMKSHIVSEYLSRYSDEWSAEEIANTADMVAQGAIKYGMNVMDTNKKIVFDMREWLKLDGESGPYIQYTCARINSLINKSKIKDELRELLDYSELTEPAEVDLMLKILRFHKTIESCARQFRTSNLCTYLYELSKLFNSFYHDCPILKIEDQAHRKARLALAQATLNTLSKGLSLLGIPTPEKM